MEVKQRLINEIVVPIIPYITETWVWNDLRKACGGTKMDGDNYERIIIWLCVVKERNGMWSV